MKLSRARDEGEGIRDKSGPSPCAFHLSPFSVLLAVCCLLTATSAQYVQKVITAPVGVYGLQYDSIDNRVFGAADSSKFVVIDCAAESVIAVLSVPGQPVTVCYDAQDDRFYWVDWTNNLVQGMNAATFQFLTPVPVGLTPGVIGWNPADDRLYCSCTDGSVHQVKVIDCAAESVVATIDMSEDVSEYCFDTRDNKVYCAVPPSALVQVVDGTTDSIVASFPINLAEAFCYNPPMNRVYWGCGTSDSVTVINCSADTVVAKVLMGRGSQSCCFNPRRNKVYFGAYTDDNVTVVDCATNQPLATIRLSPLNGIPWALCYDPHSDAVYAVNHESLTVIDGSANIVVKSMMTPCFGRSLAFDLIQNRVYFGGDDHHEVVVVQDSGTGAIAESPTTSASATALVSTIVRGVLELAVDSRQHTAYRAELLDISGRKALDIPHSAFRTPHSVDVSRLSPGVYFVRLAETGQRSVVRKIVIAR